MVGAIHTNDLHYTLTPVRGGVSLNTTNPVDSVTINYDTNTGGNGSTGGNGGNGY